MLRDVGGPQASRCRSRRLLSPCAFWKNRPRFDGSASVKLTGLRLFPLELNSVGRRRAVFYLDTWVVLPPSVPVVNRELTS